MSFTHFALLAKFGDVNIPLEKCSLDYFGIAPRKANEKTCLQDLPVPAYKLGGQRSAWFVNAQKPADFIDKKMDGAQNDWEQIRAWRSCSDTETPGQLCAAADRLFPSRPRECGIHAGSLSSALDASHFSLLRL